MIDRPAYLKQILPFVGKNIIKILVGVRRSGKSTLLGQIKDYLIGNGLPIKLILSCFRFPHTPHRRHPSSPRKSATFLLSVIDSLLPQSHIFQNRFSVLPFLPREESLRNDPDRFFQWISYKQKAGQSSSGADQAFTVGFDEGDLKWSTVYSSV